MIREVFLDSCNEVLTELALALELGVALLSLLLIIWSMAMVGATLPGILGSS